MLLKCHEYHKAKWYIASIMTLEYAVCYVYCNEQIINNIWSFFLTVKCNVYQRKYNFNIIFIVIAKCMINSVLPIYDVYHTVVSDGKTFMKFINQLPLKKILPLKYFLKALIINR